MVAFPAPAANGTVSVTSNCSNDTYTLSPEFNGVDTFTYKANDDAEDSVPGTVTIFAVIDPASAHLEFVD